MNFPRFFSHMNHTSPAMQLSQGVTSSSKCGFQQMEEKRCIPETRDAHARDTCDYSAASGVQTQRSHSAGCPHCISGHLLILQVKLFNSHWSIFLPLSVPSLQMKQWGQIQENGWIEAWVGLDQWKGPGGQIHGCPHKRLQNPGLEGQMTKDHGSPQITAPFGVVSDWLNLRRLNLWGLKFS